jgi:hypothetical protein
MENLHKHNIIQIKNHIMKSKVLELINSKAGTQINSVKVRETLKKVMIMI